MAININTLFTQLGKLFFIQETLNTARGTTVPPLVLDVIDQFDSLPLSFQDIATKAPPISTSFQSGCNSSINACSDIAELIVTETLWADGTLIQNKNFNEAIYALVEYMVANSNTVDQTTVTVSGGSISSGNVATAIVISVLENGKAIEQVYPETIVLECTSAGSLDNTKFSVKSNAKINDELSHEWPAGSGLNTAIGVSTPLSSYFVNSGFDVSEVVANVPDGWYLATGTAGTTLKLTAYEVQQIAVTGPPTTGTYRLSWVDANGMTQQTEPLEFDAKGADVLAALNALTGLEEVTVATTGTTPLFTHAVTFVGLAGSVAELTVINSTDGTVAVSTTTAGSTNSYTGRAVEFDSNGSELTSLIQEVELAPRTRYGFNIFAKADVVPAAGVITAELIEGIGGATVQNDSGVDIKLTITCSALTTSFVPKNFGFTTPRQLPAITYWRIRISTAVTIGSSIFLDHACLTEATELYDGGPCLVVFGGKDLAVARAGTSFGGSTSSYGDIINVSVTSDRAGEFQEYFERNFGMAERGLKLPSAAGGTETILDSLIG